MIYYEFQSKLPVRNGGELNYLQAVYNKRLIGLVYGFQIVLLGFSSGNSYTFGKYVLFAINRSENEVIVRAIGVLCISVCCYLHVAHRQQSNIMFTLLGVVKVLILSLIIVCGALTYFGVVTVKSDDSSDYAVISGVDSVGGERPGPYSISVALLEIIYSFKGWENVNYVLNETKDPHRVLTVYAPLSVFITTCLYFMVILSYLVVIPKQELMTSGALVAGIFFDKIFGQSVTSTILPLFIAISNFGNVLVVSYTHSVVNQQLANDKLIPQSKLFSRFEYALALHWLVTVVVLVLPPSGDIYEFVVNLYIYPGTWINALLSSGLVYMRYKRKSGETEALVSPLVSSSSTFKTPMIMVVIFLTANTFMALFPFLLPPEYSLMIPYWCFPTVGTGVLFLGVVYYYVEGRRV